MNAEPDLKNISIVLVETRTPGNLGSVARAMMNMGLSRLVLVDPPRDPQGDARKLAAGAVEILDAAVVHSSLRDAVGDQGLVIGTSRHLGRQRKNIRTPREMAAEVLPLLDRNSVSFVFGNEVNGLDREQLSFCHEFVSIPASIRFPSLNLSHAVMVIAYELFAASRSEGAPGRTLALEAELEHYYRHLESTLTDIGFLEAQHSDRMLFSLGQIFGRARLDARDVKILEGILSAVDRIGRKTGQS